jgi:hypothetical protein
MFKFKEWLVEYDNKWGDTDKKIVEVLQSFPTFPYFWMTVNGDPVRQVPKPPMGMKPEYINKTSDAVQKLSGSHQLAEYVYSYSLHPYNMKRRILGWVGDSTQLTNDFPVSDISKAIEVPINLSRPMYQKMTEWLDKMSY